MWNNNRNDLLCSRCKFFANDKNEKYGITYCEKKGHGDQYIQYKCSWCCNIAAYHCGGMNYYCMHCHDRKGPSGPRCRGKDDCPLGIEHPPNGSMKAFAVGCGMCKEIKIKGGKDLAEVIEEQMKDKKKKLAELENENDF